MSYKIGDTLRYEFTIKDIILSGGMGEVYIIEHKKNHFIYAAKTFKEEFFSKPGLIDRFIREANLWVGLGKHVNIVQAFNVFQVEGRPFIILEYISNGSLETLLMKNEKLTIEQVLAIGIQICNGMTYVHETAGIVHRDLKLANILMDKYSIVKVTDFGLAALIQDWAEGKAVEAGGFGSTDIYAMGKILLRLLTGQLPFNTHVELSKSGKGNSRINEDLENIVRRCLKGNDQYQSFRELKEDLEQLYRLIKRKSFSINDYLKQQEEYIVIEKGRLIWATEEIKQYSEVYNKAVTKCEIGEFEDALKLIDKALKIRPDFADAWNMKGNALKMLNKLKEAEQCYKKAIQLDSQMPEVWVNLSMLNLELERYDDSLKCLDKALKISPDIAPFWAKRAQVLLNFNRSDEAMNNVNTALDLNPKCTEALYIKANILGRTGYTDQAIFYLSRLLEVKPRETRALVLKASLLFSKRAFTEATKCFSVLCEIHPENADYLEQKGLCHFELGEFEKSLKCFEKVTELNSSNGDGWYNRGLCLQMLGRTEEAKDFYIKAISIIPNHFKAHNNLGVYYLIKRDYEEALKWFEKAITIDPLNENLQKRIRFVREISNKKASYGDETIYQLINDAHEQMERGNFQEAYQLWQKVVKNGFEDTEILYNIAYCLWNLGKHSKAIEYCNKVLNRDSLFVHALNIKGNALDDIGDHKRAIECYKKSVEIDPDYYEAWNGMGLSYKAIGDFEQAMKCYEEAIKIKPDFFRAWFNKANLLDDMNKTEDAINAWEETKKIVETEDVWNNLGHCLFKIKKYDEALHAFEQAIRLNPNSAQAWTNKGATLTAMNKFNEAVECFKEALRIKPDFGPAKRNLNRITRSLLQKNKAKTKTDGITPLDVMKYYKKAMDHIEESNYDAVVDNILKAENILATVTLLFNP